MEFSKETPEKTKAVVDEIKCQINSLSPTLINKEDKEVQVKHELLLTMIDGKVAQVLTDTSSASTCTICGATPRQMNDLTKVTARSENEDSYQYGLVYNACLDSLHGNDTTYFLQSFISNMVS